ncbi:MAG: GH2 [uncultured Cytophagales bacterium]|uniref:GH2 n=1 Tax=uncultured Cytophagales bacterium TaxID=158755 RepID=A0A6J4L9G4_9SPHI|nr:MAG: GH2 [uncultured Cytophagales bacterium]
MLALPLALLLALPATAQYTIRQPDAIPLHGAWHFTLDPAAVGEPEGWYRSDYPMGRWDQVPVPHCFSVDKRYLFYTGTAWYRRTFPWGPAAGKRVRLHFDAAYYACRVWLNDRQAGTHEGGYTPFSFDVTDLLKEGENTLAVSVDNNTWKRGTIPGAKDEYREADAPGGQFPGWMNYGGLVRPVYLTVEPEVYAENVKVEADPDLAKGTARLRLKIRIRNASGQPVSPKLAFRVEGNGKTVSANWKVRTVSIPAGGTAVVEAETVLKAGDVKLWSPDEPNLYQLRVTLAGDTLTTPFGIRKVEVRNAQLLLNGKPLRAAGGNRVVDYPELGSLEPDWLVEKDLRLMKEAGMELSRLTHYTPSETVLDWADRNGMLIITEAGNWQLTPRQMDNDTIRAKFRTQFREMAERDWNHPSVIAYSVGNEYLSERAAGQRWTKDMIAYGRSLDATRLFTFASMRLNTMPKNPADEASQYVDFVSTNTYGNHAAVLKKIHELYPDKPILVSEYGRRADDAEGEAGQVSYLAQFLADIRAMPYVMGAAWWSFNDYQSRYPGTNANGYRPWGLVGPERNPRPLYAAHRREMAPVTLRKVSWLPGGDGRHGLRVRITARNDFPSYAVRGYQLKAGPVALPIPDLQPGQSAELTIPVRGFARTLAVEIHKPTGFPILHQLIDLTNDPRTSNR